MGFFLLLFPPPTGWLAFFLENQHPSIFFSSFSILNSKVFWNVYVCMFLWNVKAIYEWARSFRALRWFKTGLMSRSCNSIRAVYNLKPQLAFTLFLLSACELPILFFISFFSVFFSSTVLRARFYLWNFLFDLPWAFTHRRRHHNKKYRKKTIAPLSQIVIAQNWNLCFFFLFHHMAGSL